jgi:small ubiquitin-related modifier
MVAQSFTSLFDLISFVPITMTRGAAWGSAETAAAARAYVDATNNPLRDAEQKQKVFVADLLSKLEGLAPAGLDPKFGLYHHRGAAAWTFLRDSAFKDIKKFINGALLTVYLSNPSGVTEQQKINVAVAIHMKKTKVVDHEYKDYDATKEWRNYLAWIQLRDLPTFRNPEIKDIVSASNSSGVARAHTQQNVNRSTTENNTVSPDSGGRSKRLAESDAEVSVDPVRLQKRIKTATLNTEEGDTKTVASSLSEEEKIFTQVSVFSRPSDFNETTWYMIDLEHRPRMTQGATPLVARCMRVHHWPESEARKILKAYRQFLVLKKIKEDWNAEILSPSAEVDLMWHQHILDVVNYSHDCMLLCGHVIGHNPDGGLNDSARAERRRVTQAALTEHFGAEAVDNIPPTVVEPRRDPTEPITIRIRNQTGEETSYCVRWGQRLGTVFEAYARRKGANDSTLRFLLDGERILDHETARMLELTDQDRIDCVLEQSVVEPRRDPREPITIRIRDQTGEETFFKILLGVRMGKVFEIYARLKGVDCITTLRFMLDCERILEDQTPEMLELKDQDLIMVMLEQSGC